MTTSAAKNVTLNELMNELASSYVSQRLVAELDGHTISVAPASDRQRHQVRVYVSGEGEPDLPRPSYMLRGEDPAVDRAWRKYNQAEVKLMRKVIAEVAERYGIHLGELRFSLKAGCSCPCSPGFIARHVGNYQVWITVKK